MRCRSGLWAPAFSFLFLSTGVAATIAAEQDGAGLAERIADQKEPQFHLADVFGDAEAGAPLNLHAIGVTSNEDSIQHNDGASAAEQYERVRRAPMVIGERDTASGDTVAAGSGNSDAAASAGNTGGDATTNDSTGTSNNAAATTTAAIKGYILMAKPLTKDINNLFYWARGTTLNMTWNCYGATSPGTVSIFVQRLGTASGGGGQLTPVARHIGNSNGYSWAIPANYTVGTYMVFVEDDENPVISNSSLMSIAGRCQPYSSYNPYVAGIYNRLDYTSLLYLVNSADAAFTAAVFTGVLGIATVASALLLY